MGKVDKLFMNITTISRLFPGSVHTPLRQHRLLVLETLVMLSRQLQNHFNPRWYERPDWLNDFPATTKALKVEVLTRLKQPRLTDKAKVLALLQTQENLAQLICTMAERLTYRPLELNSTLQSSVLRLNLCFAETVQSLKTAIEKQERFRGVRRQLVMGEVNPMESVGNLRQSVLAVKGEVFENGGGVPPLDMALLLLSLEDMDDLTLWLHSMVNQIQQN